jgi:hypothetical protein
VHAQLARTRRAARQPTRAIPIREIRATPSGRTPTARRCHRSTNSLRSSQALTFPHRGLGTKARRIKQIAVKIQADAFAPLYPWRRGIDPSGKGRYGTMDPPPTPSGLVFANPLSEVRQRHVHFPKHKRVEAGVLPLAGVRRSRTTTRIPFCANRSATIAPTIPAPPTAISWRALRQTLRGPTAWGHCADRAFRLARTVPTR